ncbi:MAG TPA: FAD-binding oxidoreductase [Solirubrobacterales bacterium]|jgi:FAD/FMN-containing dehydrogenase|nr:FAD-binding oxidoreductase [Solirubrobacterales bacterium]
MRLYDPGSPEYDDACTLFNAMIERHPRHVARCESPDDVAEALAFARDNGLEVSVRAGGHSVAGLSLNDGGLVLDVRGINAIDVDPDGGVARVGGGATWSKVDRATQEHGLATTGGRVSTTGVAGLTLGGGSGWLERKHGLTVDNVLAVELVTADGRAVRASEDENPDLFWAVRGGGGNFGVATAFEFRLHPLGPEVFGGLVLYAPERGRDLLRVWRDLMADAPEGLSLAFAYLGAGDEPDVPEHMRNQPAAAVAGMYAGPVEEGEEAVRAIREFGTPEADFFGPMPYTEFQCSIDDPPGMRNYWTAEYLAEMPDEALDRLATRGESKPVPFGQVFLVAWGGAVGRVPNDATPLTGRDAKWIVHPLVLWEDPADDEAAMAWGRGIRDDVGEFSTGETYTNFIGEEGADRVRAAFGSGNLERLALIKAEWDPQNVFRATGHVPPAEVATA